MAPVSAETYCFVGVTFRLKERCFRGEPLAGDGVRAKRRLALSDEAVRAARDRIGQWLDARRGRAAFARFTNHLDVLDRVLTAMLDAVAGELAAIAEGEPSGSVYERCARLDGSLAIAVRLFEWYASKYDQRLDHRTGKALAAADEIVRSCWSEPFSLLGRKPPAGPLAYLEPDFDAFATPRVSVPRDLQGPADSLVAEFLRELPIPLIALPGQAASQPWWLVLAAHETGHHVQHDLLPDLEAATRERLIEAVGAAQTPQWAGWAAETFADAYSVLMVGEAAAWAIDELQHATPARMCEISPPGASRYPPAAVRLALLAECLRTFGVPGEWPTADQVSDWLDGLDDGEVPDISVAAIRRQLAAAPAAADALADLPIGTHRLRELGDFEPDILTRPQALRAWAAQLARSVPVLDSLDSASAARQVIAAGVAAYRACADRPESAKTLPVIRDNLLGLLPGCGPPGVLEAPPREADVTELARRLARRLVNETASGPGEAAP